MEPSEGSKPPEAGYRGGAFRPVADLSWQRPPGPTLRGANSLIKKINQAPLAVRKEGRRVDVIKKRMRALVLVVGLTIMGTAIVVGHSSKAAMLAHGGTSYIQSDSSCFDRYLWGQITNDCATTKIWCFYPMITNGGTHTVSANGDNLTTCYADALYAADNAYANGTNPVRLSSNGGNNVTIGNVNVPAYGSIQVCCDMEAGATLNSVNF